MAKYEKWLEEDGIKRISAWARDGLTQEQIAKNMDVALSTLKEWKNKFPAISAAIKRAKEIVDIEVENSLYKKAIGHTVEIKKTFKVKKVEYDPNTGKKVKESEELKVGYDEVYVPPDTTAIIYWLSNRKPETWKNRRDEKPEPDGEDNGVIILAPVKDGDDTDECSVETTT